MGFSALQRAENSSINEQFLIRTPALVFQCSSASRKFLNAAQVAATAVLVLRFSALQRAENSSMLRQIFRLDAEVLFQCSSASRKFLNFTDRARQQSAGAVSVLFSEPKIPQSCGGTPILPQSHVSVLFSEPKIPQSGIGVPVSTSSLMFQCSSASRKFLNSGG